MKELIGNLVKLIASVVFLPLLVIGILYSKIKHIYLMDYSFSKQYGTIFKNMALAFDMFANACSGELLNDLFLKKGQKDGFDINSYKYGKHYDTISEVTGVNETRKTLNKFGVWFTVTLGKAMYVVTLFDKSELNHSIKSINPLRKYK